MADIDRKKIEAFKKGELKVGQVLDMEATHVAAILLIGHTLYNEGRLEEAKKVFEGLATLDVKNPYVHGILGSIYQKLGQYDVAVARYTLALRIFPQDVSSLTNRGEVYLKFGRLKEAAGDFKAAIALDPDQKHPAANRARLLAALTREALSLAKEQGVDAVYEAKRRFEQQYRTA